VGDRHRGLHFGDWKLKQKGLSFVLTLDRNFGIRVAKNRLAIQFRRSCGNTDSDSCRTYTYAIVDASTGNRLAAYEADKEVAGTMACYAPDPDRLFTFTASLDHHGLDIVEAGPK
jgi:hypothetical protein